MASATLPSHEMLPTPGPETVVGLKPLPQPQLEKHTQQAHQILVDAEKTIRTQDEATIKNQLTSVSEESKKAEVASLISTEEESLNQSTRELDKFIQESGGSYTEAQLTQLEENHYPAVVENLDYTIAATESEIKQGKTEHQVLHDTAVETRGQLENTTEVTISYDDKTTETYTLASWNKKVRDEAVKLWKKEINPAAADDAFEKADPLTQFAYTLKAKGQILKEKPGGKIQVRFIHERGKPDKPATNSSEAEKAKEADKAVEELYAEEFLSRVGHPKGKDGKEVDVVVYKMNGDGSGKPETDANGRPIIAEFHPELLEGTTDVFLSGTTHLFAAYLNPATSESQRHNIMAMIYKHIEIANPDRVKGFVSAPIMNDRLTNRVGHEFTKWLAGNGFRTPLELSDATFGDMVSLLSFSSACQRGKLIEHAPGQGPSLTNRAAKVFGELFPNISPDYQNIVIALASDETQDWGGRFLSQQFNLDTTMLSTQAGRTENVNSVIAEIAKRRNLSSDEQEKYKQVMHDMVNDKKLEEMAKKLGLPPGMGMGILMLALFMPMLQGVFDTGGGGGEERGGQGG